MNSPQTSLAIKFWICIMDVCSKSKGCSCLKLLCVGVRSTNKLVSLCLSCVFKHQTCHFRGFCLVVKYARYSLRVLIAQTVRKIREVSSILPVTVRSQLINTQIRWRSWIKNDCSTVICERNVYNTVGQSSGKSPGVVQRLKRAPGFFVSVFPSSRPLSCHGILKKGKKGTKPWQRLCCL